MFDLFLNNVLSRNTNCYKYRDYFKIIQARWRIYVMRVGLIGLDNGLSQSMYRKAIILTNADLFLMGHRWLKAFQNVVCKTPATEPPIFSHLFNANSIPEIKGALSGRRKP